MKVAKLLAILAMAIAVLTGAWLLWPSGNGPAPLLSSAVAIPLATEPGSFAVTMTIENRGGPDRLTAARSDEATSVAITGGTTPEGLPIPANGTPQLAMDGAHLRLSGLKGDPAEGRLIPVTLHFATAGDITTRARISAPDPNDHAAHGMDRTLDLGPIEVAPKVMMDLRPEGDGWAIKLDTGAFQLTETGVDGANIPGQGHAHLYLDGLKLERMYGPIAHIGALPVGQHIIQVILNSHDHRAIYAGGKPVGAIALIDVR